MGGGGAGAGAAAGVAEEPLAASEPVFWQATLTRVKAAVTTNVKVLMTGMIPLFVPAFPY